MSRPCESGWPSTARPSYANGFWSARAESRHNLRDQLAVNVRQPHVAAVEQERQARMVDAEQWQRGGVQIVDRDRLLLGFVPDLVAGADDLAALDSRARHP